MDSESAGSDAVKCFAIFGYPYFQLYYFCPMILPWSEIKNYLFRATFTFRALRSRNYAIYIMGMLVSVLGTWIQIIATGWLVYRLTNSAYMLGVVTFAGQIPSIIVTPFAGVYADRINRRKVILGTQISAMILSLILALLVLSDNIDVWHIILLSVLSGVVNAVDTPFRHAFIRDLVENQSQMSNAIALNSMLFNTARFVGPMVGGILIALIGEGWCFMINAISFLAVIVSLFVIHTTFHPKESNDKTILQDLKEGIRYSFGFIPIRYMLILIISTGFFILPFQSFLPVFAKDVLSGDSSLYGALTGFYGAGALIGAMFLASRKSLKKFPQYILIAAFLFSGALAVFSYSGSTALSMFLLLICGWAMIAQYVSVNTLLQTISHPEMVGRVISFYGMSFMTVTPLGALLIGKLTKFLSIQDVFFAFSCLSLVAAVLFYVKKNAIVSEVKKNLCHPAKNNESDLDELK
ncbi:Enterobactin exporter EntS [bioreactor metagenome]|uniref:Enterobactin exporter EntS n=1 Tax=bioreactor metagenome TaxID=1076179 RepID=A0A644YYA8_9ZZZZ